MTEQIFSGTFAQGLQSPIIRAGDRLLLHAGTYSGDFTNALKGTAENLITIMSYPGEWVKIDGSLTVNGSDAIFQNLEFTFSGWTGRQTNQLGGAGLTIKRVTVTAPSIKFINCVIHDIAETACWSNATSAEFYGCVIYNCGWQGPGAGGSGHGIYSQNNTTNRVIKDCFIGNNFGWGIHAYTEGGTINNHVIQGCTCFGAGAPAITPNTNDNILIGGYQVANNVIIQNCMTYGADGVNVGYVAGADNVTLENNYFPDGITKVNVTNLTEAGNYYGSAIGDQVFLRANDYDANRANLTIYNQAEAGTIEVDVSSIYSDNTQVQARNVQDYSNDIQILTVTAGKIIVNMQAANRTVATPVQWTAPATTYPLFGCFVLIKQ